MQCIIKCSKEIDFTKPNSIGSLLGFHSKVLEPNHIHESKDPINIMKISKIRIECNITTGSFINDKLMHTIHEFFPAVPPGYKIIEIPQNVICPLIPSILIILQLK